MWQRFTERARRVVFFAQEEAGRLGQNYVSTEHLLLGLLRENDSVAARILDKMGVSLGRIRSEIERQVARGDGRLEQDMQLTPRTKRVIDLAYDEARLLSVNYIGTEHLLLGLIREGEGLAGRVLTKLAVELHRTRREIMALMDSTPNKTPPESKPTPFSGTNFAKDMELMDEAISVLNQTYQKVKERQEISTRLAELKQQLHTPAGEVDQQVIEIVALRNVLDVDETGWRRKSLVSLFDVTTEQYKVVLDVAARLKALDQHRTPGIQWSYPRTLGMIFEKPSLRTRVSFEASMVHLRGHAIYLAPGDVGLGVREPVEDVAGVLSRWVDVIAARVFDHSTVEELAKYSTSPVINALSDKEHPIQSFADLLTLQEYKGELGNHLKLAYVGDGNNVLHALLLACAKTGVNLSAACPEGYFPEESYVQEARRIAEETKATIEIVVSPEEAVVNADAVYTDVWASMGQEAEREERARLFASYVVTSDLMAKAKPDAIALHDLPAHRGEEITAEVMATHKNSILDQAENRLHTQKALLTLIVGL